MEIDAKAFQQTITEELDVLKNRVRFLIGDANWGEEGRYKEAILRSVIKRFLPGTVDLGTGFVVREGNQGALDISNQIDIIVYDNHSSVLFREGDFIVTTPSNVRGIIEVKTSINSSNVQNIIDKSSENGRLLKPGSFNGIFVFEENNEEGFKSRLKTHLEINNGIINHFCFGRDTFIKYWESRWGAENSSPGYRRYHLESLSYSFFISNLCDYISGVKEENDRRWFLFPTDKERHVIDAIICRNAQDFV
ncbi:hypothetical protein Dform_00812 [Dehalogenimonas formicexedens]|uniref:DUF6602 domain-containing protein n=1 Tax=Dehalogenimonas formicexedens TaxID=1839801 RepID=A0A1P8F6U8_9CHLR|nr:DUF6602 domain-containing protein [Dehalogenimonas formicexedens]APV44160.1 hypothetical protein Dform_00812 [Dehalogenimonas formicexedens]